MASPAVRAPAPRPDVLTRWTAALERVGRVPVVAAAVAVLAVIGLVDSVVDPLMTLSVFYLLPVLAVAATDRRDAVAVALLSTGVWCGVDVARQGHLYASPLVPTVNAVLRFAVFLVVVELVAALRHRLEAETELARVDALTGLANARSFYERVEQARRGLERSGNPVTLAYLDLDDFKLVNDRLGHAAGDEALRRAAVALAAAVRADDVVARLGGDEFAVLLDGTDAVAAGRLLERVGARLGELGVSIGAVTFTGPVANVDEMVGRADAVMYEVKQSGKRAVRCVSA